MESGQPIEETRKGCFTMIHRTQARASASRWIQRTMLLLFMIVPLTGAFSAAAAVETDPQMRAAILAWRDRCP